ncbi:sulfotransferase [Microcoleus vaginatus]|uniref:sulfotransferase n=1 Tax=Microcoleus vaginatus TaxID=119532 RepID=UPI0016877590|nr:sulfotransferase [Microcoleus sp. FACHB-84]MBD2011129.1 sulfotransferase [Microcoleus sp. FACHB-45]
MPQKAHFISGLPRSGSTLLAAILRQNPRFHASMTSPVGGLVEPLKTQGLHQVHSQVEFKPRKTILPPDLFEGFNGLSLWEESSYSKASVIVTKQKSPGNKNGTDNFKPQPTGVINW